MFHPREYVNEVRPHGECVADTVDEFLNFFDGVIML